MFLYQLLQKIQINYLIYPFLYKYIYIKKIKMFSGLTNFVNSFVTPKP